MGPPTEESSDVRSLFLYPGGFIPVEDWSFAACLKMEKYCFGDGVVVGKETAVGLEALLRLLWIVSDGSGLSFSAMVRVCVA